MKRILCGALLACTAASWSVAAIADEYPSKPIRLLLGFSAGGSADTVGRYYATKLAQVLKTSVVVVNRPGGSQLIAIRSLLAAKPDGYTLFMATGSAMSQGPGVRTDLPYDPLKDFTPIALAATAPGVIVTTASLPIRTIGELATYSKAHPDKINYGSSGLGSASNLQTEYLKSLSGIKMTHIPFKADAEIMSAIASGSVQIGLSPLQGAMPSIQNGHIRPLAVTGSKRVPALPDVPALSEVEIPGLGAVDPYTYYAVVGPKGMPEAVVKKLNDAINEVSKMPETIAYMQARIYEPEVSTSESLQEYVAADLAKWKSFSSQLTDNE
ncbi:tripartite tricarboxylate transporter substrate binding protein [Candidimonas sp. SYP-B2681]|uniref:Bug family tripartite tricarboxylate transporter substrate binding protein n=1 Tax=Candidimonas sp. SYP-B2681 TaxID=2497686 RepID=UPI000F862F19|nr:tripartite tricarboxylate transporter substrate binding protein [Candidimonas sp. SYP-B2681]RTZ45829.1 tripartite tricarboxylate transporter substrate binding protein [Candidimonas sp. SYP-B2681]